MRLARVALIGLAAGFVACGIDSERRPQTLSVEEWACLATQLAPLLGTQPQ